MIDLLTIAILSLAAYRITRFFVEDSLIGMGSYETLDPDTQKVVNVPNSDWGGVVMRFCYKEDGTEDRGFFRGKLGDLLGCIFCLGFWISCTVLALWTWSLPWQVASPQDWVLTAFAIAGVQAFIGSRQGA